MDMPFEDVLQHALLNSSNKKYWKIQKLRGHLAIML
ncbi:hypothetical protein T4C_11553 [Trichinella pseudospiralis]|uniref:Uncharacterized protein n=1 Tax=Trichinella pseudospiralis TaxID=6337 RepID=A0A0V1GDG1_TRIPS|nr:hypothetical protein T4C_11553 [Trichinella pseudospiralis]